MSKNKVTNTTKKSIQKVFEIPLWGWLIFFAFTTLIMFWQQLTGDAFFWEDFAEYIYPSQSFAATESAKGIIPFWNPFTFNGMPFLADMQVGFFYPMNRLLTLFVSDGQLSIWALQFLVIIHFFIAQLSMYLLGRELKLSSIASATAAVSFAFSFLLVLHVIHPMIVYMLSWFPLVIMFTLRALDNNDMRSGIFAGLIFGGSMLAGHPQITLYEIFFLGLLFLWKIIFDIKDKKGNIAKFLIAGLLPFVIAAGLFQIQYLQTAELAELSQRAEMTYEASAEGSLQFKQLFTAFAPDLFGEVTPDGDAELQFNIKDDGEAVPHYYYWETAFYFGIAAIIFGLFTVFTNYRDRIVQFLLGISILGALYALGDNFFIHKIFYNLPLFEGFRNPGRMMLFPIIGFSLLGGMGIDKLLKSDKKDMKLFAVSAAIPVAACLAILSGLFTSNELPAEMASLAKSQGYSGAFIAFGVFSIGMLAIYKKLNWSSAALIILVIASIDLITSGMDFNQSSRNPEKSYELDQQTAEAFQANPPNDIFRVNTRMYNPRYMAMNRNIGMVERIMLVEGYNPLVLQKVTPPLEDAESIHDALNVKYELAINPNTQSPYFKANEDMLPRAWVVHDFKVFGSDEEVKSEMSAGGFDISKYAALEQDPGISKDPAAISPVPQITEYTSNSFKIKVDASEEGLLCLSEIYYPAWKAYVNGEEKDILRANYALRAVPVPKGESTVELKFQSSSFTAGMWISIITLILAVVGIFIIPKNQSLSGAVKSNTAKTGQ